MNSLVKKSPRWLFVASVLLLLLSAGLWWTFIYSRPNPDKLFWDMLDKSLATESITIETDQEQQGMSVQQIARYQLGAANRAHSATIITQGSTVVKSEVVANPDRDYTRYTQINTDSTGSDGKPLDFSKIINVWAEGGEGQGQLFNQALFDNVVLHANLAPAQRQKLLDQIRSSNVYEIAKDKTKKRTNPDTGRLEYEYTVNIQYIPYVYLLKHFAQQVGLHNFDNIDPNDYSGTPAFETKLTVDARSRRLVSVEQVGGGQRSEYSGHGIPVQTAIPKRTISEEELQSRFAELE